MKIGVISDTHIPRRATEIPPEVLERFRKEKVDLILHAGDLVDIKVIDKLRDIAKTIAVYGNMDAGLAKSFLHDKEIIQAGKFKIGLTHGGGPPFQIIDTVKAQFSGVDAIVFGHTHFPINEVRDGILFFNPGSATDRVFANFQSFGMLYINDQIRGEIIKI